MNELNFDNFNWDELENNLDDDVKGGKKSFIDDRYWKLSTDENGSGGAIIKLLIDKEQVAFTKVYKHAIQSYDGVNKKKRWYINTSPSTVGLPCPASEIWAMIKAENNEQSKEELGSFRRQIKFVTNIKVIKDPANPENEGKIFLWEFGKKIKDKFDSALKPSETERQMGEEPKQLYDPTQNWVVKVKQKKGEGGFPNYDDTTVDMYPEALYKDREEIKKDILEKTYTLSDLRKPEAFRPYEELKSSLKYVLETYTPKHIGVDRWNIIYNKMFGDLGEDTVTQTVQTTQETKPQGDFSLDDELTPQPQPQQSTQTSQTQEEDDLDFLNEL